MTDVAGRDTGKWVLTQESFDHLLGWLAPDRDAAGKKYEEIRQRLIKVLVRRGCDVAEDLADETFNRVSKKLGQIIDTYQGDPAFYFLGVAHNVFLEHVRRRPEVLPAPCGDPPEIKERNYGCLERCMEGLDESSRDLILQYYQDEKRAKIDHRRELADSLGVAVNALRTRVYRIKSTLKQCVFECVRQAEAGYRLVE